MDARDLLFGAPEDLLRYCPVALPTAQRWKRTGRLPAVPARLIAIARYGELGELWPAWEGFILGPKKIFTPGGFSVSPGEICAIPYRAAQLAALESVLRNPHQWQLPGLERR